MPYKDKEEKNKKARKYYHTTKESRKDRRKEYNKNNAKKKASYDKKYYQNNKEKKKAAVRKYGKNNVKLIAARNRKNHLTRYGITLEEYEGMLEAQGGRCAICGKKQGKQLLCVDHNHKTSLVRGLLCRKCNAGIGMLRDDVDTVLRAVEYLRKHE